MKIPLAKDNQVNIAPQVGGIKPISPVAVEDDSAKAGIELKNSLQNAADGFVKLYAADKRADAIKDFNDYQLALDEYRNSAEIDPQTGEPIGFNQLKGDQVTEDKLKQAQLKVQAARKKFHDSLRGSLPDIQDEFGMRADEAQASFDMATNAHFLKTKYEKAKNKADLDNTNIKNNTYFAPEDTAKIQRTYKSLYNNYYAAYPDKNLAEKNAQADMQNIIENNVNRIIQEGEDVSYDNARSYMEAPNIKKVLGEEGYRVLKHKVDLESAQWQMKYPTTTTESIKAYIEAHTTNLTPKEKALFIAEAQKRDAKNAGGVGDKSESYWREMVSRLGNAQENYLMNPNEFGISVNREVNSAEAAEFQSRFLTFTESLMGALNNTPYNENVIRKEGLDALLPKDDLRDFRRGKHGELMRAAVNRINEGLKDGSIPLLTAQQTSAITTIVNKIKDGNSNIGEEINRRQILENELLNVNNSLTGDNVSVASVNEAITRLRQYEDMKGLASIGYDDPNYLATVNKTMQAIENQIIPSFEKEMSLLEKGKSKVTGAVGIVRELFDTWTITLDPNKAVSKQKVINNNLLIRRLNKISNTTGKNENGSSSIVTFMAKIESDALKEMMNGQGLTLYNVREDGTVDTATAQPRQRFAVESYKPNGVDIVKSETVWYKTANQFMDLLNLKYKTNTFNDFRTLDMDALSGEDKRQLRDLFTKNWLEANGIFGKTMLPVTPVYYQQSIETPVYLGNIDDPYEQPAYYKQSQFKKEDKDLYLSSLDFTLADVKIKDFVGGVASNEDLVNLLEAGYVDGEDYSVQLALENKDPNVSFTSSEIMHDMLSSLAPWGLRSKYIDPKDGKIKQYYQIMNNLDLSATAALSKDKSKQEDRLSIKKEELELLDELLKELEKDNPGLSKEDFLRPLAIDYNVSEETFKNAVRRYQNLRNRRLQVKRQTYMLVGGLAPSKINMSYFAKQEQSQENK